MDSFEIADLRCLAEIVTGPCVTIYLPTSPRGVDSHRDRIRLHHLVGLAERMLVDDWLKASAARDLVAPLLTLADEQEFWEHRGQGLALFLHPDSFHRYRLPLSWEEMVTVERRFRLQPIVKLLDRSDRFLVLTLSQHKVRLFAATEYGIEQVEVSELPQNLELALNLDGADRGSQSHFGMNVGGGKQSSVFHGQGGVKDTHKQDLETFFRGIDRVLSPRLRAENRPLLLAGVGYLLPIFRDVCSYAFLAEAELVGNFDDASPREIHHKAWPLIQPSLAFLQGQFAETYHQLEGTPRTTADIRVALPAAFQGRVETLVVSPDLPIWGQADGNGQVEVTHDDRNSSDDDLIEMAAVQTLLTGGNVQFVGRDEIPSFHPLAALLRH